MRAPLSSKYRALSSQSCGRNSALRDYTAYHSGVSPPPGVLVDVLCTKRETAASRVLDHEVRSRAFVESWGRALCAANQVSKRPKTGMKTRFGARQDMRSTEPRPWHCANPGSSYYSRDYSMPLWHLVCSPTWYYNA